MVQFTITWILLQLNNYHFVLAEVTIKNLRDKVKEYEDKMESVAEAKSKEKEKELQRSFANKERWSKKQQQQRHLHTLW